MSVYRSVNKNRSVYRAACSSVCRFMYRSAYGSVNENRSVYRFVYLICLYVCV